MAAIPKTATQTPSLKTTPKPTLLAALLAAVLLLTVPLAAGVEREGSMHGDDITTPEWLDGTTGMEGEPPPESLSAPVKLAEVEWAGLLWGSEDGYRPAPILSATVETRVSGLVARTRLTQSFENASGEWMEGLYLFPLPEDAAVDRLRLVIGDRVLEGEIREKEEARRTYEAAKAAGKKATLVEQRHPNAFTTRVANVAPGETVEVILELQQTVRWDAGEMSFRFPTVINPRFTPRPGQDPHHRLDSPLLASAADPLPPVAAMQVASCLAPVATLRATTPRATTSRATTSRATASAIACGAPHSLAGGGVLPAAFPGPAVPTGWLGGGVGRRNGPTVNPVRFEIDLDAGFPLQYLESPYHAVDIEVTGGTDERPRYQVRLAGGAAVSADRDFELVWSPRRGDEPRAAVFREEYQGDTYSLLMVLPPSEAATAAAGWGALDRELVFILDVSGSMHGAALEQAKLALNTVLDGLDPGDSFNVIAFSDRARPLFPDSLPANAETVAKARGWVEALQADGGTQMLPALAAALDAETGYRQPGLRTVQQVIFLTDGAVGNEAELFRYIADHLGETRLFTVGIGPAPNAHFMRRAAEEGRGTYTFIGDPAEVALKVETLARKLESPVLTDLEVRWDDPTAESWPRRLGDLYAGEPLVVASRGFGHGDGVELAGRTGGAFWSQRVDLRQGAVPASAAGGYGHQAGVVRAVSLAEDGGPTVGVRQLWARGKIAALESSLVTGADPAEVRRRVVEVALDHHLVSRYTSLVAVDRTPVRPDGEPLVGQRPAQVHPAGWTPPGVLPVGATAWPFHLFAGLALLLFALTALRLLRREAEPARLAAGAAPQLDVDGGPR